MKEVTDPAILAQFEKNQQPIEATAAPAGLKEVTDPAILAQFEKNQQPVGMATAPLNTMKDRNIGDVAVLSGVRGLAQNVKGIGGLLSTVGSIPKMLGKSADYIPMIGVPGMDISLGGAGDIISGVGSLLQKAVPQKLEDMYQQAKEEYPIAAPVASAIGEYGSLGVPVIKGGIALAKGAPAVIGKISESLMGSKKAVQLSKELIEKNNINAANRVFEKISGGKTIEDAGKSIASDTQNFFKAKRAAISNTYNSILDPVKKEVIAPSSLDEFATTPGSTFVDDMGKYSPQLKKVFNNFSKNPTVENAHALQSDLFKEPARLMGTKSAAEISSGGNQYIRDIYKARENLNSDLLKGLNEISPQTASAYNSVSNAFKTEVAPFYDKGSRMLYRIANGEIANPTRGEIAAAFRNPEPRIARLLEQLSPELKNKIVYNAIGKESGQSIKDITKQIGKLDNKGLGGYLNPEVKEHIASELKDALSSEMTHLSQIDKAKRVASITRMISKYGLHALGVGAAYEIGKHILE